MTKKLTKKQRHQVKSRFYYIFWGAATLSVFAGQLYVGSGYRRMAKSFDRIVNTVIIEVEKLNPPTHLPEMVPEAWDDHLRHPIQYLNDSN
tara:strand:+ start:245 stop:517 length:273 start_codon:yes stop_codon:yes gene_type:complete